MSECIFCQIFSGDLPSSIVYQDDLCTALMDIQPVNSGHVLIIPNNHVPNLAGLDKQTGFHLFGVAQRVATALRASGIRCEGVNLFMADGEAAGQEVFHVHLHVFPRYRGDGFELKFSERYWMKPERGELEVIAKQIRDVL
jgi:histidine triad (HIT) family protein